jgi:hypothetical protein
MRDEYPQLLADNLNGWFNFKPERRMVRALDGKARAFLSDSFRRIDNFDIATAAIPVLYDFKGIEFRSMEITENRMYIKATLPSLQREIKSARVGDVVEAGIMLTNSEVGLGMWSVSPYALYLWCLNGASREGGKKWRHVGGKIGGEDMQYLAEDTVKASDKVDLMVMRDTIRNALSEASFEKWIESVQETTAQPITGRVSAAIEVLSEKLVLNSGEADNVLQHLIRGGDMSRYGLMNAVTRTAEDAVDYDRATQFEAFGQTIIDLPANEWREIAEAA